MGIAMEHTRPNKSNKTVSKVCGFRLTKLNLSHLASASDRHLHWEIPYLALIGIAQLDQAVPCLLEAKIRLNPAPQFPPQHNKLLATRPRCVVPSRRMALASTVRSANSLMVA